MKKKVVFKLRQEVKVKIDIVTSDDIKIYYKGKFQDFTARYIIKYVYLLLHNTTSSLITLWEKAFQDLLGKNNAFYPY